MNIFFFNSGFGWWKQVHGAQSVPPFATAEQQWLIGQEGSLCSPSHSVFTSICSTEADAKVIFGELANSQWCKSQETR